MQTSDADLVKAAVGGDRRAFHTLVDRFAGDLFKLAMSLAVNRQDAEDVVQETFTAAFTGLRTFAGRSSVKTWLNGILVRQAAKTWHASKRLRLTAPLDSVDDAAMAGTMAVGSAAAAVEQRIDLEAVLAMLSADHRQVIVLREVQGMSYEEMARTLRVPRGTVESRLHRARQEIQERLGAYEN